VDKRIGASNELRATLPYSGESFGIPSNLFIIGTMNTADRSIALLDSALRRRFHFVEMMPDIEVIRSVVPGNGVIDSVDISTLLDQINGKIELLFDREHQIGHSYFLGVKSLTDLRDVFRSQVIPLLQEYFYSDWTKICIVLGCPHDPITGKPLSKNPLPLIKVDRLDMPQKGIADLDGIEPRCRYQTNLALESEGANLAQCFQWVQGLSAGSDVLIPATPETSTE
jgi:5-methylcytosine-specific restriction endonuclease McrBC GTP-binding regulatory subunit McrB